MTVRETLRRRLAGARGGGEGGEGGEDGIALMMALMVILIAGTLSVAVAAAVVGQVKPSQSERKLTRTVSASEAGFDAALNRIRAANNGTVGVRSLLPCGPIAGQVSSNVGGLSYSVAIQYYSRKPLTVANRVSCSAGGPATVPAFATLISTGSGIDVPGSVAGAGNRTLRTVYDFKSTNANVAGGLIHLYDQDTPLCLEVSASGNPAGQDDKLHLATCDDTNPGQKWSYTPDLLLQVAGTSLCLEARSQANAHITLQPCAPTNREQRWSFNDIGRFEGAAVSGDTNGWCFTSKADPGVDGSRMEMQHECGGGYDFVHTLSPEARVGAGAAGESNNNLVNYKYFGRCLDVTNQNVGMAFLIGYPCKQRPDPAFLTWNQVFTYNAISKQYVTAAPSGAHCLQAGDNTIPPTSGVRVLTKPCNVGETYQRWDRTGNTGTYSSSYNIKTANGLCLTLEVPGPPEAGTYLRQWGMILAQTCNGSLEQKWNAPPNTIDAKLSDTREGTGG